MAMSVGGKKKGGRRRSVAEINVTPLVDVMLVLLVIFMITAPTLKEGFSVDIPRAEATQSVPIEDARMITVTETGDVLKPNADTAAQHYDKLSQLVEDLKAYKTTQAAAKKQPVVVIVGDRNARYERIIQVWNAVRTAGIPQVSFELEPGGPETSDVVPAGKS
jgi:biopolymer transport protein TolR